MTLTCNGELINFDLPKVMGILNITPDSFYDGGAYSSDQSLLNQVEKMLTEGATFIDVGAYSSKPNADDISTDEELKRLIPVLELLNSKFEKDILISVDTFRSKVAKEALSRNVSMINDISAGQLDPKILDVIAQHQVPYIMMHMKGSPQTMKSHAKYNDVVLEVKSYFSEKLQLTREKGINDVIIDPGFGFAKTIDHNFEMLNKFELFKDFDLPLLCGISRKSMIYKTLNTSADKALNGTTALHSLALHKGANILRVHDVKEAVECIALINKVKQP
ncbi:dihydropteroate synthase [Flavobacteriaceae bacterium 14752]|uniref:dihydropteroate synthase n=1 Tax=Mesohalobacter salilacus TaxID=2491711 RepID=UPI000F641311|nr:dihydropteroate synthase [Flavobacteriaceae bacterium 14752]